MATKDQPNTGDKFPNPKPTETLSDNSSTDEDTSYYSEITEEDTRGTIPGSTQATAMA